MSLHITSHTHTHTHTHNTLCDPRCDSKNLDHVQTEPTTPHTLSFPPFCFRKCRASLSLRKQGKGGGKGRNRGCMRREERMGRREERRRKEGREEKKTWGKKQRKESRGDEKKKRHLNIFRDAELIHSAPCASPCKLHMWHSSFRSSTWWMCKLQIVSYVFLINRNKTIFNPYHWLLILAHKETFRRSMSHFLTWDIWSKFLALCVCVLIRMRLGRMEVRREGTKDGGK